MRRHKKLREDEFICVFEITEASKEHIFKFLKTDLGNPKEEEPEIGRTCFTFAKNGKVAAKLCLIQRPESPGLKNTLMVYDLDVLKDVCDYFDVMLSFSGTGPAV